MRKRLRKKLHVGEFQELGFEVRFQVADNLSHDAFDAVVAFQVLEHLPFGDLVPALQQLVRASCRSVILSLPHYGYDFQMRFRLWKWKWGFSRKISKYPVWSFNGEHYWEIGTRGHSLARVSQMVGGVVLVHRQYFCPDYPYHYFFECETQRA